MEIRAKSGEEKRPENISDAWIQGLKSTVPQDSTVPRGNTFPFLLDQLNWLFDTSD